MLNKLFLILVLVFIYAGVTFAQDNVEVEYFDASVNTSAKTNETIIYNESATEATISNTEPKTEIQSNTTGLTSEEQELLEKLQAKEAQVQQPVPTMHTRPVTTLAKREQRTLNRYIAKRDRYARAIPKKKVSGIIFGIATAATAATSMFSFIMSDVTYESYDDNNYDYYGGYYDNNYNQTSDDFLALGSLCLVASTVFGIITIVKFAKFRRFGRQVKALDQKIDNLESRGTSFLILPNYNFETKTASLNLMTSF